MPIAINGQLGTITGLTAPVAGGSTVNAPSSSALVLTNTSSQYQVVQCTTASNNTVTLPNATTVGNEGPAIYVIENRAQVPNATLVVLNSQGGIVGSVAPNFIGAFSLLDNTTAAGTWSAAYSVAISVPASVDAITAAPTTGDNYYVLALTSSTFILFSYGSASNNTIVTETQRVCTISGSTISIGSPQTSNIFTTFLSNVNYVSGIVGVQYLRLSDTSYIAYLGAAQDVDPCTAGTRSRRAIRAYTLSAGTVTFGTPVDVGTQYTTNVNNSFGTYIQVSYNGVFVALDATRVACIYNSTMAVSNDPYGTNTGSLTCVVASISGATITLGTPVSLTSSTFACPSFAVRYDTDRVFVQYSRQTSGAGNTGGNYNIVTISFSGTTVTWNTAVTYTDASSTAAVPSSNFTAWGPNLVAIAISPTRILGIVKVLISGNLRQRAILFGVSGTTPSVVNQFGNLFVTEGNGFNTYLTYAGTNTYLIGAVGSLLNSVVTQTVLSISSDVLFQTASFSFIPKVPGTTASIATQYSVIGTYGTSTTYVSNVPNATAADALSITTFGG